ncbi:hypothetical protein [Undibacterium seohonense]|uniref:hypothetical protein n=1 Tax=Undibacterium seohonense TaxID=1344950 RepID=UPI001C9A3968|nr:hypothetical protein [Undibacterium seohonense]
MKFKSLCRRGAEYAEILMSFAEAGVQRLSATTALRHWIPAYAAMTNLNSVDAFLCVLCASAAKSFLVFHPKSFYELAERSSNSIRR